MFRFLCIFIVLVLGLVANSAGQICSVAPPINPQPPAPAQPAGEDGRMALFVGPDVQWLLEAESVFRPKKDESRLYHASPWEVKRHRINKMAALRVPVFIEDCGRIVGSSVRLKIDVDDQGKVVSATPINRERDQFTKHIYDLAENLALAQRFRPFEDHGKTVPATFTQGIDILPPEDLPVVHVPFPKIRDWKSLKIESKGSGYALEIQGNGDVIYQPTSDTYFMTGRHRDRLSLETLKTIVAAFKSADFFSLPDQYRFEDAGCEFSLSISFGNYRKSLQDCNGGKAGMPESVTELEEIIGQLVGVDKWQWGNEETVPSLIREGFDFRSSETAEMLRMAPDIRVLQEFLDAGASPKGKDSQGETPLYSAVQGYDIQRVRLLIKYGADPNAVTPQGDTILMAAARAGIPEIISEILKYNPDVNARNSNDETVIQLAIRGYFHGITIIRTDDSTTDRPSVVRLLARAGANLNTQNEEGKTPLHYASDIEVVKALVQNGANANLRDEDGNTPLLNTSSPEIAKALLEAGADPSITDNWGHTALDIAKMRAAEISDDTADDEPDDEPDDNSESARRQKLVEILEAAMRTRDSGSAIAVSSRH